MALSIRALANGPEEGAAVRAGLAFGEADDENEMALVIALGGEREPVSDRGKIPGRLPIRKRRGMLQSCTYQAGALGHHDESRSTSLEVLQRRLDEISEGNDTTFSGRCLEA